MNVTNDLYFLDKELEKLYNRIPIFERENDISSQQKDEYNKALNEYLECGRKVFNDPSLRMEDIKNRILEHSILSIKALLAYEPQDILSAIQDIDNITSDAFTRLEYCLSCRDDKPSDFYQDKLFANDRKFIENFSEEDFANFKRLQDYIRKTSEDTKRNGL